MATTDLNPWRDDWADRLAGRGCVLCDLIGDAGNDWGRRFFTGQFADAYLPKADQDWMSSASG